MIPINFDEEATRKKKKQVYIYIQDMLNLQ